MKTFIANKEALKENIRRLKESKNLSEDKHKNQEILDKIRKDQEENGKYYMHSNDNTYNPFKEFFSKK